MYAQRRRHHFLGPSTWKIGRINHASNPPYEISTHFQVATVITSWEPSPLLSFWASWSRHRATLISDTFLSFSSSQRSGKRNKGLFTEEKVDHARGLDIACYTSLINWYKKNCTFSGGVTCVPYGTPTFILLSKFINFLLRFIAILQLRCTHSSATASALPLAKGQPATAVS